jgi:predicted secreted Zn-dependent protease
MPKSRRPALRPWARVKPPTVDELNWLVAQKCNGGSCVRVATRGEDIVIGDTKNPGGPVLTYSRSEWTAFVDGIREGDFDGI